MSSECIKRGVNAPVKDATLSLASTMGIAIATYTGELKHVNV